MESLVHYYSKSSAATFPCTQATTITIRIIVFICYFITGTIKAAVLIEIICLCLCLLRQVKWSGSQAEYSLDGEFPEMLFTISRDGVIYLNAPLDRETQDQV